MGKGKFYFFLSSIKLESLLGFFGIRDIFGKKINGIFGEKTNGMWDI